MLNATKKPIDNDTRFAAAPQVAESQHIEDRGGPVGPGAHYGTKAPGTTESNVAPQLAVCFFNFRTSTEVESARKQCKKPALSKPMCEV